MSMSSPSSPKLASTPSQGTDPTVLPEEGGFDLAGYRLTKGAQDLVAFIRAEVNRSKTARTQRQLQWYQNMANFYGKQWLEQFPGKGDLAGKLVTPKKPYYQQRKTVNRIRAFVRAETAQFLSGIPEAVAVPATAENEDVRAAYAAEQAWQSISETQKLRYHYSRAVWWMVVTGNGFLKTWWDQSAIDKASGQEGAIRYGCVTPFHLFVPDLREQDIDDQPWMVTASTKTLAWCRQVYGEELEGVNIQPSQSSGSEIVDEGHLNLASSASAPDSCVVYEAWLKPGAHKELPYGGVVIIIEDTIVGFSPDGFPYRHDQYPITKFEHIPTSTFYADSPLVDLLALQREYNTLRSQISDTGHRMSRPQWVAPKGSIVVSKMTNEPGGVIEYVPLGPPPQQTQLTPLPQYYVEQQDRILTDFEDISGQHDVSRGVAPTGVTAGTAINFLQEADNSYRTPQFLSVEDGYQRIATQTLELFVQMVDVPRKIKTVGADGAFDTVLLQSADIAGGTDIRIQKGSGMGVSKAAQDARVMDLFQLGAIPPEQLLSLLEVGGAQKILDIIQVAEKKAQRENSRMKALTPEAVQEHQMQWEMQTMMQGAPPAPEDPSAQQTGDTSLVSAGDQPDAPMDFEQGPPPPPPVIPVDDFDVHEKHIEVHNAFRMSQEYEILPPEVKEQFQMHVAAHEQKLQQKQLMSFLNMIPSDGSDGSAPTDDPASMDVMTGAPEEGMEEEAGPGTMAANGAVPEAELMTGEQ